MPPKHVLDNSKLLAHEQSVNVETTYCSIIILSTNTFTNQTINYSPPGISEMVSGIGSAIGISFPSPGVLIVLKLNSIEVDPQIIEILQSYISKIHMVLVMQKSPMSYMKKRILYLCVICI